MISFLDLDVRTEYECIGSTSGSGITAVLLHHGLGSVSAWHDFPARVADFTGLETLVYSRRGYGESGPAPPSPWPSDFMHTAALEELPAVLRGLGIERPLLVGHSDGASIALLYAASGLEPAPHAMVLLAPHVFVEAETLAGARRARRDYEAGALGERLARHHADPDAAFYGWYRSWLDPGFRDWNIQECLPRVSCPVAVIQGDADEYGTLQQVESIRRHCGGPVRTLVLPGGGHAPHRHDPEAVLREIGRVADDRSGVAQCADRVDPRGA